MPDILIEEIYARDSQRRVCIFRRAGGTFFYQEEYFSSDEYGMCWVPKCQHLTGFYDSRETARREAIANVDWQRDRASRSGV